MNRSKIVTINRLIFSIFLLISTSIAEAQNSVPFQLTTEGHIIVKAKVNGVVGNFVFDTGAGLTLITKGFAYKIEKLHKEQAGYTSFRGTGEQLNVDLYDAETLAIGALIEHHPILTVFDIDLDSFDGLISLKSFKDQPFTIDYINKKIIFETNKSIAEIYHSGKTIHLQLEQSRDKTLDAFAYFVVNDKLTLQFLIDSGSGSNAFRISSRYIPVLNIDTSKAIRIEHTSESDPNIKSMVYKTKIRSIKAKDSSDIHCDNINASIIDGLIYDGIVSLNWIGDKVTFDLNNSKMIVR
jgi:hypothetical protein